MSETEGSAVKVVGFNVEGESKKKVQRPPEIAVHTGSPLPVSIPPPFNRTPRGQYLDQQFQDIRQRTETAETTSTETPRLEGSELTRQITPIFQLENKETDAVKEQTVDPEAARSSIEMKKSNPRTKPVKQTKDPPQIKDTGQSSSSAPKDSKQKKLDTSKSSASTKKPKGKKEKPVQSEPTAVPCVSFFDHLDPFKPFDASVMLRKEEAKSFDDRFLRFCIDYAEGKLNESSACKAMLESFIFSLEWFRNDVGVFYSREVITFFNQMIGFLIDCRSLNVAMRNIIRAIKVSVTKLPSGIPLEEGKEAVRKLLRGYIEDKIDVLNIVAKEAEALIKDNDVILTYAASDTILCILQHAWQRSKKFRVVIVDARPQCDGKRLLEALSLSGIPCQYCLLHALSFALKGVSKVMMGTSAVLSNGTAVGRAGSAMIATMASTLHVPVVLCCQTLKFHERVQLDSFTHNELGDARQLFTNDGPVKGDEPNLSALHLKYDLMPAHCISVIVSELGFVPAANVPAILREQANERENQQSPR